MTELRIPDKVNLYEIHNGFQPRIQLSYKGPFDKHILAAIGNYIKTALRNNPIIQKKVFSIFIEIAQNIAYYSAEVHQFDDEPSGIGSLVIGEFGDYYTFASGNVVRNKDIIPVVEKCKLINSLDREKLRQYKRELRSAPQGDRGNGHIGLIQVALTAEGPLDFTVTPINESHSFFTLSVKVDKNRNIQIESN